MNQNRKQVCDFPAGSRVVSLRRRRAKCSGNNEVKRFETVVTCIHNPREPSVLTRNKLPTATL